MAGDEFFKQMIQYQYVAEMTNQEELSATILSLSGGIPDLAVKLFLLSQMRLFGRKQEKLTVTIVTETATQLFYSVQDRLVELKGAAPDAKDIAAIAKKLEESFNTLASTENERVGGHLTTAPETRSVELFSEAKESIAGKMIAAAKNDDPVAALEALGVVAHPK